MTHAQAIAEFKAVKTGDIILHIGRRVSKKKRDFEAQSNALNNVYKVNE